MQETINKQDEEVVEIIVDDEDDVCQICYEHREHCNCKCPNCGNDAFNDATLGDHGKCYDCHKKWQLKE